MMNVESNILPVPNAENKISKILQKFLLVVTIFEVALLLIGALLGKFNFRPGDYTPFFSPKTGFGELTFYILAYLPLIWMFFRFLVVFKFLIILKNFYAKEFRKSSLLSAIITVLNPAIIGSLIYRISITYNTFYSNPSFPGFRTPDFLNAMVKFIDNSFIVFLILEICLLIIFLFLEKKDSISAIFSNDKGSWFKAIVTFIILAILIPSANQALASLERNKLTKEATDFRLSIDQSGGKATAIKNFEPTNISSNDGFSIKFEWQKLSSEVSVSSRLVVLYTDSIILSQQRSGDQQSVDYLKGSCTIQSEAAGSYYCNAYFSSHLPDFQNKKNYSFFIDNTVSGNSTDRDETRKIALKKLLSELQNYKTENGQYPCSPEYTPCQKGESQISPSGKTLPKFDWSQYKDPLTGEYYNYFTSADYFDSKNQPANFIAAAKLEVSFQDNDPDYYCIDSNGVSQITTYMPDYPDRPYSCLNIYKSQAR